MKAVSSDTASLSEQIFTKKTKIYWLSKDGNWYYLEIGISSTEINAIKSIKQISFIFKIASKALYIKHPALANLKMNTLIIFLA